MRRPDRRTVLPHGGAAITDRRCGLDHLGQWLAALAAVLCFSAIATAQEATSSANGEIACADGTLPTVATPQVVSAAGRYTRVASADGGVVQACANVLSDGTAREKK